MTLLPRSIAGRFLAVSLLTTVAALVFAAVGIGHVLERFVVRGIDQQLDAEVAMLARAIGPDGRLRPDRVIDLPTFAEGEPGWGWRVETPRGRWMGGDALRQPPPLEGSFFPSPPDRRAGPDRDGIAPGEAATAGGLRVHTRQMVLPTIRGDAIITAGAPRRLAVAPLRAAMLPLLGSLAILGLLLAGAAFVQLRVGLRPLGRLRASLAEVRAGRARHVPDNQPAELAPLAAELNALVEQNAAQLAHARRHVANLAHGLKTPLAALALRLAEEGVDPAGTLRTMVGDIDARVRHHLGRARAAAPGAGGRARTPLGPAIDDLVAVMRGVRAERTLIVDTDVAPDLVVAADPQDVDEMIGNLLDNGWRHARSTVRIAAVRTGGSILVTIEDDGLGLPAGAIAEALVPGRRLDERGDGHGFGLPIAQELAELNGGGLALETSPLGGLRATLSLPAG